MSVNFGRDNFINPISLNKMIERDVVIMVTTTNPNSIEIIKLSRSIIIKSNKNKHITIIDISPCDFFLLKNK